MTATPRAEPREPVTFLEFIVAWNAVQGMDTPALHRRIARWLARRRAAGDTRLLLLAFRASGKSTLVGLFCAWLLLCDPDLRILVLAAEGDLAAKMVRNIRRILERHPFTPHLKPRRLEQWAADRFTIARPRELRDPSVLARGIGANVTGSRADIVICDDVEVPNTCDTAAKRADLRERLAEIDYILVPGGMQLYAGTPHSYYSLYADTARAETGETQPFLDGFARLALPLLDTAGRSTWPERFDAAAVAALRRRHGPSKFRSQMQLIPELPAGGRLDPDLLCRYEDDLAYAERNGLVELSLQGRALVSATCWWDPAFGAQGGDRSVAAVLYTDAEGRYWLHRLRYLATVPQGGETHAVLQCRQVAALAAETFVPAVTVETNGVGRFLPSLLRRELAAAGVGCAVVETASRMPKALRIAGAFDAVLAARNLYAHAQVWDTPFAMEMREWRPDGAERAGSDDGLDAVAGCLLAEPVRLHRLPPA
ncbi:MAG: phage terminase large subunit, partial [Alphaproteobacteria bacterium]